MGIFGNSSPFDCDVEKATTEKNTSEEWGKIMDICDKVGTSSVNAKDCLRSIIKRLNHPDPHVVLQAITLLDACVNNCGKNFHLEIASRDFETEYRKLLAKAQPPVVQKLKGLLKKWSEGEFKSDPQLNLIPSLLAKMKSEGVQFNEASETSSKKKESKSAGSSISAKERDDLALAIELSLQESKQSSPRNSGISSTNTSSALYPTMSQLAAVSPAQAQTQAQAQGQVQVQAQEARKVRALYDFEAAEDNELTFMAGEIIHVVDSSDPNWWKGYNQRGEGLFPANFVTSDLSVEPQASELERKSTDTDTKRLDRSSPDPDEPVEINENKIDRLLSLLHEANPEDSSTDTEEMLNLEAEVNRMGPLIDMELEKVDRKHARLTQLSSDLVDALNLYHTLMREPPHMKHASPSFPQHIPPQMMYSTSAYGNIPQMPPFYSQAPHASAGSANMMASGPPSLPHQPMSMPMMMGHPHGPPPQQMPPQGPPHMSAPPGHIPGGIPPNMMPQGPPPPQQMNHMHAPTSMQQHPQYIPNQQPPPTSMAPAGGLYHQAPPGAAHNYVM